jgi:hypothetical protein
VTETTIDVSTVEEIVGDFAPPCGAKRRSVVTLEITWECGSEAEWYAVKRCGCLNLYCDSCKERVLGADSGICATCNKFWVPARDMIAVLDAL